MGYGVARVGCGIMSCAGISGRARGWTTGTGISSTMSFLDITLFSDAQRMIEAHYTPYEAHEDLDFENRSDFEDGLGLPALELFAALVRSASHASGMLRHVEDEACNALRAGRHNIISTLERHARGGVRDLQWRLPTS